MSNAHQLLWSMPVELPAPQATPPHATRGSPSHSKQPHERKRTHDRKTMHCAVMVERVPAFVQERARAKAKKAAKKRKKQALEQLA